MNIQEQIAANRDFCKSPFAKERELSDQQKRLPQPPLCKPAQSERRILLGRDFRSVMTQTAQRGSLTTTPQYSPSKSSPR